MQSKRQVCLMMILGSLAGAVSANASFKLAPTSPETFSQSRVGKMKSVVEFLRDVPACSTPDQSNCPRFYLSADQRYGLVDLCTSGRRHERGLYLVQTQGAPDFRPWFDSKFNEWSCQEGCTEPAACFYTVDAKDADGRIRSMTYAYETNLSHGFYQLELTGDHKLKIINQKRVDEP